MFQIPEYDYAFVSQVVCLLLIEYYYCAFSDLPGLIKCYVRREINIILEKKHQNWQYLYQAKIY